MKSVAELLMEVGFQDKEQKFDVIPQANNYRENGGKLVEGKVLRKGDSREICHYRSLLFRRADTKVIVDTMMQQIGTPDAMRRGVPIHFLGAHDAYAENPDKTTEEVNFDRIMQVVANNELWTPAEQ